MPPSIEPMLATLDDQAVQRPGLAVRDQVGRLPRPGRRRRRQGPDRGRATSRTPRPTSRGSCDRRPGSTREAGDRRRRGRRARRRRAPRFQPPPGTDSASRARPDLVYQAFDLLYLDGRLLLDVALEDRKRLLKSVLRPHPRVRFAAHVEGEGEAFHEAAEAQEPRGHRRQAQALAVRAGTALQRLAQDQDPARAGARRRRLDAGRGQRPRPRRARGRRLRGRQAAASAARSARGSPRRTAGSCSTHSRRSASTTPPFDPPPPKDYRGRWGGDLVGVTWVRPELVIRAELGGWSRDGMVRQAAFKGIEPGRDPTTVAARDTRSRPASAESVTPEAE